MLFYILGFIFSTLGIVGYFNEISILVVISFVFIIIDALIGLYSGLLRSIKTYVFASIIGFIVAICVKSNMFLTIAVALCFEELTMQIITLIFLIVTAIIKKRKQTNEKSDIQ